MDDAWNVSWAYEWVHCDFVQLEVMRYFTWVPIDYHNMWYVIPCCFLLCVTTVIYVSAWYKCDLNHQQWRKCLLWSLKTERQHEIRCRHTRGGGYSAMAAATPLPFGCFKMSAILDQFILACEFWPSRPSPLVYSWVSLTGQGSLKIRVTKKSIRKVLFTKAGINPWICWHLMFHG